MSSAPAPAKLNLALVVGPVQETGKHELGDRLPAHRACRPDRARAGAGASRSTDFRPTRSSAWRSKRSPERRRCRAGLARVDREAGSRRGRSGWRLERCGDGAATRERDPSRSRCRRRGWPRSPERSAPMFPSSSPKARSSARATAPSCARSSSRRTTRCFCFCRQERRRPRPPRSTAPSTGAAASWASRSAGQSCWPRSRICAVPSDLALLPANDLAASSSEWTPARARRLSGRRDRRRPGRIRPVRSRGPTPRSRPRR